MPKSKFHSPLKHSQRNVIKFGSGKNKRHRRHTANYDLNPRKNASILRLFIVWGILVAAAFGLGSRLYYLQVINPVIKYEQAPQGKRLTQIAQDQQTTKLNFYIPRRQIVDRQQNVLATDKITYTLYVHPHLFKRNSQPVPSLEIASNKKKLRRCKLMVWT